MPPTTPTHDDIARVALAFAQALARRDWTSARSFLSAHFLDDNGQPVDLERHYNAMTQYWDNPANVVELSFIDAPYAFVNIDSISETHGCDLEGVAVQVELEAGHPKITRIIWGRP